MAKNKKFLNFFCKNAPKYPDDFEFYVVNKLERKIFLIK